MDPASSKPPSSMFVSNKASNDSNPMGNHKIIPTSDPTPAIISETAQINQMIPSKINNSTDAIIKISVIGNIANKNANKINLSTIVNLLWYSSD
jgi:hypothetical protein